MHNLLKRQLQKYVRDDSFVTKYKDFINVIDNAYAQFDEDRIMLERSLDLSSQELIETNADMRAVFQAFPDILFRLDPNGKILDIKTAAKDELYLTPQDILGKNIRDMPLKSIVDKIENAIEEVKQKKSVVIIEYPLDFDEGSRYFEARFVQLPNEQIIVIIRNITERKIAEKELIESEERYRKLFNSSKDAIMTLEPPDWKFTSGNPAIMEMFGLQKLDDLTEFDPWRLSPEFQPDGIKSVEKGRMLIDQTLHEGSNFFEWTHKRYTGEEFPATVLLTKVEFNDTVLLQATVRDITEEKKAENEIKKAHEKLSQINKKLEQKVEERTIEISKLLKQKDEFISQLGHDLKNPLGPLMHLLPIVERHTSNDKDKEILKVIQRNVGYMKNLVQKTLELARLNSPHTTLSKEQFNLKNHVDDIIEKNKLMLNEKQIVLSTSIPDNITIVADPIRTEELFNNLLTNAFKYNKQNGQVIIQAYEDNDFVTISIKDDGIGMTANQLDHIFDEFYKADESRHDFDSSGLGMAICKRIVEKHGGKIWAESEGTNKGCTFYFTLPTYFSQQDNEKIHDDKTYHEVIEVVDSLFGKS